MTRFSGEEACKKAAPVGKFCIERNSHKGRCLFEPTAIKSEVRTEVAARAILAVRFLEAVSWDRLTEEERDGFREEAAAALDAVDKHRLGCVWREVTNPGRALPMVVCDLCGNTGWLDER